jgi:hypothetical protein
MVEAAKTFLEAERYAGDAMPADAIISQLINPGIISAARCPLFSELLKHPLLFYIPA